MTSAYADQPDDVVSDSPDGKWEITAKWLTPGTSDAGYAWTLKNLTTGKVYFNEKPAPDQVLPRRFTALRSPGSHYVALDLYFGRAVNGVTVVEVDRKPEIIDPLPNTMKPPLEQTLIKPEDLPAWDGSGLPLIGADSWLNDTDLVLDVEMKTSLGGKAPASLDASWRKTVHFSGATPTVIATNCDSYDKEAKGN